MTTNLILPIVIGYLIGSIPFGLIAGKIKGIDIRKVGSGNIGATNTVRALGKTWGAMVFFLDMIKGAIPVWIAAYLISSPTPIFTKGTFMILAGLAAVIGHMFPIYIGFKGGKGAATGLGVLLGITPDLFVIALIYVIICMVVTRYVSVTSMSGVVLLSILMFTFHKPTEYVVVTIIVAILMIYKHIPNIKRLINGTEPKIGAKKK
jgi:acyl phosphate:glycerol-3-phosphate acyltransferase